MRIMISSEALHKGITKVVRATPSLSDGHEVLIETVEDNGILIRRQGTATYAEFFLHCAVNEPGCVIVHPDGFKFLQSVVGDMTLHLQGTVLKTNRGASIKTKDSGEESRKFYTRKRPEGEFWLLPEDIKKILWSSDKDDMILGFVFMSEANVGVANKDEGIVCVSIFEDHLPERKAVFPASAFDPFKDDEYVNALIEKGRIWLKCGGFMSETIFAADQNKIPLQFQIIAQADLEEVDYFFIDREEFTRVISQIVIHARSSTFDGGSRCYIELREDGSLYIESNWSDNGQIIDTFKTKEHSGTFQVGMYPPSLLRCLTKLERDVVRFYYVPMMGSSWPLIPEGNVRYAFFTYETGWRAQNELPSTIQSKSP